MRNISSVCIMMFLFICQSTIVNGQTEQNFSTTELKEDFSILKDAITTLHSGLYRYADTSEIESYFNELERDFENGKTIDEAYLSISKLATHIKCGHTYANYYNQDKKLQQNLFLNQNKLPFTFKIVADQLVITKNLSNLKWFNQPCVITSINDIPTNEIVSVLLPYIHTDGSNLAQKYDNLQVTGQGEFEAFDIFFPLLFDSQQGQYKVKGKHLETDSAMTFQVSGISRRERKERIKTIYGETLTGYDDLWKFEIREPNLAILKMGTFVTYKMELNWKQFIDEAFSEIQKNNIENVLIDIRGNAGGLSKVGQYLKKYLLQNEYVPSGTRQFVRTPKTPDRLRPFLHTWENSFYDMQSKVKLAENGMYESKKKVSEKKLKPTGKRYRGNIYLFVDASNSSATFHLAKAIKESKSGTLIGQDTGGNMKGTTAGAILFLTLPNTKIEIDIPLIASVYEGKDEALQPDVFVPLNALDIAKGIDTEMNVLLERLNK